jgi:DNA-binding SARP family transcriptional activator
VRTVLEIRLFGISEVRLTGTRAPIRLPPAAAQLLAYLVLHRAHPQPREVVATTFWTDLPPEAARRRLNTAVWRLGQALEGAGVPHGAHLSSETIGGLALNAAALSWLDVADFETAIRPALGRPAGPVSDEETRRMAAALVLYRGELLEGVYADWTIRERERLAGLRLQGLARLLLIHQERGDFDAALGFAQQILERDPLREDVHRCVMRLLADSGRRTQALRQFTRCAQLLHDELDVTPLPETVALAAAIRHGSPSAEPAAPVPVQRLLDQLVRLRTEIRGLDSVVTEAIDRLGAYPPASSD